MKIRYKFGIKLKITIAFSLVFICLSLFFNVYCYQKIKGLLIDDNNKYLLDRADRFLSKIEVSPVIIPLPDKNTMIRVLYHSLNNHHVLFESPGIIKKIKTPVKNGVSDTLNMRVTYVSSTNEDNPAELVLVTDGNQLNKSLDYLLILLFAGSLISVVIAGLVSYILAFYLLRPVQKIINAANVINTNQLKDLIPLEQTNDELQELTETINSMLSRIERSLQQQQNFFASASHELKTPLAILRAELELGLKKTGSNPEVISLLKNQLEEINRLQLVVQEFLMISQLKSGSLSAYKQSVDITAFIIKAFNHLQPLFIAKHLKSSVHFDEDLPTYTITADTDKLWIVLINIIENAVKYCPEKTVINCKVSESANRACLQIAISNITALETIDTAYLQEAFYRADAVQTGNGMGLWLSGELLKAQGASISLNSHNYLFEAVILLPFS